MRTKEQILEEINKHVEAIKKVSKEINPSVKVSDKKIVGLLIILFPEDHSEEGHVIWTCLGKICFNHTLELLAQIKAEQIMKANKIAT
jgi:hypothetical protein